MKRNKHIKQLLLFAGLVIATLIQTAWILPGQGLGIYLSDRITIGASPTLYHGDLSISSTGRLFLGCRQVHGGRNMTFYQIGDFEGEVGAEVHLSVLGSNNCGFLSIIGTATGSTEIVLEMQCAWDGFRVDLVRAHNEGSDIDAFTMQEVFYGDRLGYLSSRVEGSDRIWFLSERQDDCLPLIVQKRNNTLVVDNSGGYNFVYYTWFRTDEFGVETQVHQGAHGAGLGGIFNVGRSSLNPLHTYHAIVIDEHGKQYRTCPHQPTIFTPETRIIAYPNPTTTGQSTVVIDVETNDEELLMNGLITVFNISGQQVGQIRTNGHRITPFQLPQVVGTYVFYFTSEETREVIKVVVH